MNALLDIAAKVFFGAFVLGTCYTASINGPKNIYGAIGRGVCTFLILSSIYLFAKNNPSFVLVALMGIAGTFVFFKWPKGLEDNNLN